MSTMETLTLGILIVSIIGLVANLLKK